MESATPPTLSREAPLVASELAPIPVLVVALVCDQPALGSSRHALCDLEEVVFGRATAMRATRVGRRLELGLPDPRMSTRHARLVRDLTRWIVEDTGSKNGVIVNGTRRQRAVLDDGDLLELGHTVCRFRATGGSTAYPLDCDRALLAPRPPGLATFAPSLAAAFDDLAAVARTDAAIVISGETGTGKELVARAIHQLAGRTGAFVAINCGALPRNLIESELFGYRRGAFSGANEDRGGLIRRAHLGTLFLDEIAELPPESQVALLRVLQEGEVRPLGASEAVKVDVRIVAATHQDLRERIASGRFRQDLYGRIAGFEVRLPALRDRMEDLGVLIATILARVCERGGPDALARATELAWDDLDRNAELARSRRGDEGGPGAVREDGPKRSRNVSGEAGQARRALGLSKAAARALLRYPWPLNVRELEQTLRSAVALCDGRQIDIMHLPEAIRGYRPPSSLALTVEDRVLRERVVDLLRDTDGNVAAVARALDRAPNQIRRWCRRLRIDLARYRQELI